MQHANGTDNTNFVIVSFCKFLNTYQTWHIEYHVPSWAAVTLDQISMELDQSTLSKADSFQTEKMLSVSTSEAKNSNKAVYQYTKGNKTQPASGQERYKFFCSDLNISNLLGVYHLNSIQCVQLVFVLRRFLIIFCSSPTTTKVCRFPTAGYNWDEIRHPITQQIQYGYLMES